MTMIPLLFCDATEISNMADDGKKTKPENRHENTDVTDLSLQAFSLNPANLKMVLMKTGG